MILIMISICIYLNFNLNIIQGEILHDSNNLPFVHGGPLHDFMTGGRGLSLQAIPAGFFVPYQTHWRIRYFTPCVPHVALH